MQPIEPKNYEIAHGKPPSRIVLKQ
jgi:hypothetical protein